MPNFLYFYILHINRTGGFYVPRPEKDAKAVLKLKIMCLGYHWNSEERVSFIPYYRVYLINVGVSRNSRGQ